MPLDTIGGWDTSRLTKYIEDWLRNNPIRTVQALRVEELEALTGLTIHNKLRFERTQTTVGVAGSASALPATPSGYIPIQDPNGTTYLIPFFKAP